MPMFSPHGDSCWLAYNSEGQKLTRGCVYPQASGPCRPWVVRPQGAGRMHTAHRVPSGSPSDLFDVTSFRVASLCKTKIDCHAPKRIACWHFYAGAMCNRMHHNRDPWFNPPPLSPSPPAAAPSHGSTALQMAKGQAPVWCLVSGPSPGGGGRGSPVDIRPSEGFQTRVIARASLPQWHPLAKRSHAYGRRHAPAGAWEKG